MKEELFLYRFYVTFDRFGDIEGLIICDRWSVVEIIGKIADFGEILGKHSHVVVTLSKDQFTLLSTDTEKVKWLKDTVGGYTVSGYNPFEYIRCVDCGERMFYCSCKEED